MREKDFPITVQRGAALLDQELPGWEEQISLERLDLSSSCNCVVGQLNPAEKRLRYERYEAGLEALHVSSGARFGFTVWANQTFEELTTWWRRLIELRRGK